MSEIDDKINSILSSPEDMEKILGLARQFMGRSEPTEQNNIHGDSVSNGLFPQDMDPRIPTMLTRLFKAYSASDSDKDGLLNAVKPYLRDERRRKLDRAMEVAKMARIAKMAIQEFSSESEGR